MRFLNLFFALLLATPLFAQEVDTNTRAGVARMEEAANGARYLQIGETRVDLPDDPSLAFIEARFGDHLLIVYSNDGRACPARYVWVSAVPGAVRRTEGFGTCSDLVEITQTEEVLQVTMPSFEPGKGDVTFSYDGLSPIRRQQLPAAPSGMTAEDGWDFWLGRYPYDFVNAADMQSRLLDVMDGAALLQVQTLLTVGTPMTQQDDWIVGEGCEAHRCTTTAAAIAVHSINGTLLVAVWQSGVAPQLWGDASGAPLPAGIKAVMAH